MPYLRLDELPKLFDECPGWSARGPSLAWFRRADFLGDPLLPLDTAVRNLVAANTGHRPAGPIYLLANLRYFGYVINPISCYYCFAEDGEILEYIVAEVTNTPWREKHSYVLKAQPDERWLRCEFSKSLHVSPFHPMDMRYQWHSNTPGKKLILHLGLAQGEARMFDATLCLSHESATRSNFVRHLSRYPLMTAKVGAAIYWQALRLWLKGVPFYAHPPLKNETGSLNNE